MKHKYIHAYFRFAQNFSAFQSCCEGEEVAVLQEAISEIDDFLNSEGLSISCRVFEKTLKLAFEEIQENSNLYLSKTQCELLVNRTDVLFNTVNAEIFDRPVYVISDKKYTTGKLLENIDSLFHAGVFNGLAEMSRFDLKEGCHCIVFERNTAAAFHILRATEGELRRLFGRLSGRLAEAGSKSWGQVEADLKALSNKPPPELLEQLRHIRLNFRNPTQHPDMRYDSDEAQDLLNLCIDVINRMSKALNV